MTRRSVAVDGKKVDSLQNLLARLDDHGVGEVVQLKIVREGKEREVAVTLQPGT